MEEEADRKGEEANQLALVNIFKEQQQGTKLNRNRATNNEVEGEVERTRKRGESAVMVVGSDARLRSRSRS